MQYSTNYNMNKPELTDQYNLSHWNDNTDIIDTELKKRENDDTALKAPTYTVPASDSNLVNGENYQTAFGKIAKAISSFITHKGTTTSVHGSTSDATANRIVERDAYGKAKIGTASLLDHIPKYKQIFDEKLYERYLAVKVVALTNITLLGEQIIDGVSCNVGDYVLAPVQTTQTQNGVYKVETGSWTRLSDYNTRELINRTYFGVLNGTKKGRLYKADVDSYTEGTTILNYIDSACYFHSSAQEYWRNKLNVCEEYRPAIGIPTLWFGTKPDWAIDFGNGATTKYLWSNYPKLWNDSAFKSTLQTLVNAGWMSQFDAVESGGFYVPDLRGIVPIGYGTNAKRTGEITAGGSVGTYSASSNKSHYHSMSHTHDKGTFRIQGLGQIKPQALIDLSSGAFRTRDGILGTQSQQIELKTAYSADGDFTLDTDLNSGAGFTGSSGASTISNTGTNGGNIAKPPTIAMMWIVRFA